MGFRDYYRQFDDFDEGELNRERRARRGAREALALERLPDLDLSGTEWPDLPHSEIVNAAIARARGLVNRYPGPARRRRCGACWPSATGSSRSRSCSETARPSCCRPRRSDLLGRGDELVMPWPSYPLYPLLASHAGARPSRLDRGAAARRGRRAHPRRGDLQPQRSHRRTTCRPSELGAPARRAARARATCCSTRRSCTSRTPRTWTPACAWSTRSRACSWCAPSRRSTGCRGCAPATPWGRTPALLAAVAPILGVNALTQAAVEHALRTGEAEIERRRAAVEPRARPPDSTACARCGAGRPTTPGQLRLAARARPAAATSWPRPCAARA